MPDNATLQPDPDAPEWTTGAPESDMLFEAPGVIDVAVAAVAGAPRVTADSRMRIGYPRLTQIGATRTDLDLASQVVAALPAASRPSYGNSGGFLAPALDDPNADAKRALAFRPSTGFGFTTGAKFSGYLKGNFETRVADGAVLLQVVDQGFAPDPAAPTTVKPGLTYLRLGKPETPLTDAAGAPLAREHDQLQDQKYVAGIGLFSHGGLNAWTHQAINLRSNQDVSINGKTVGMTSYGGNSSVTYEIRNESDVARINAGEVTDRGVDRSIININLLRNTGAMGWYRQVFDRARSLTFGTANKAEFNIGASYALSIGAKFENVMTFGMATDYGGKIAMSRGLEIKIGEGGSTFKHPFGSFQSEKMVEISGESSVRISANGIDTMIMDKPVEIFAKVLEVAVLAQSVAFMAYNANLADRASKTLTAADSAGQGDNTHGMISTFDKGLSVYQAAIALSAITAAGGLVLGAVHAAMIRMRAPLLPKSLIQLGRTELLLQCGVSAIKITPLGIEMTAPTVTIGGLQVEVKAPAINHAPVPAPPAPPPMAPRPPPAVVAAALAGAP